jgi:hypothetical protein
MLGGTVRVKGHGRVEFIKPSKRASTYIILLPELVFAVCKVAFASDMAMFCLDKMLAELSLKEVVQLGQLLLCLSGRSLSRGGGLLRLLSLLLTYLSMAGSVLIG